jgi:hypothetical protein
MKRTTRLERLTSTLFVGATALFTATHAHAEGPAFGARAHTVLVLDNLAGVMHESLGSTSSSDDNGLTTVGSGPGVFSYGVVTRFGVHQFVNDTLSLGGAIHYSDRSVALLGFGSATIVAIAPRVGFVVPVSDSGAFWFRAGVTYTHMSFGGDRGSLSDLMVGGEIYYVYTPVEHFGITIGPMLEYGVSGKYTRKSSSGGSETSIDTKHSLYGLAFGFLFDL